MCGRCRHVFNAFESLKRIEEDISEPIDFGLIRSTTVGDQAVAPMSDAVNDGPAEVVLPQADQYAGHAPELDVQPDDNVFDTPEIAAQKLARLQGEAEVDASNVIETRTTHRDVAPSPKAASVLPEAPPSIPSRAADIRSVGTLDEVSKSLVRSEHAQLDEIVATTNNPLISGSPPNTKPASRHWGAAAGLAGLALLLQATYFYRSQIVQQYPQLRPTLAALCAPIQCSISWGRDLTAIKIESSELVEPPGRPGRILLSATLVNRAATKQDFPALQVKLTDASNTVLSNRVLSPQDYLGRVPGADEGLAPNTEFYVNLNLELVGKVVASGYEVRALYP
jgi:hypothetical protein